MTVFGFFVLKTPAIGQKKGTIYRGSLKSWLQAETKRLARIPWRANIVPCSPVTYSYGMKSSTLRVSYFFKVQGN